MEQLLIGILIGLVLGACVMGFLWNESVKDENDQSIKK